MQEHATGQCTNMLVTHNDETATVPTPPPQRLSRFHLGSACASLPTFTHGVLLQETCTCCLPTGLRADCLKVIYSAQHIKWG